MFLWSSSSSPRVPVAVEALPHTGQVNLCSSRCRSETCLAAALRSLTALHIAHSACLSAHQEAPTVQQARKMETVLSTNKDVIASMAPILACFCSGKSLVQLLLLSICGNLIAWNRAIISADLEPGPGDPFSSAGSGSLPAGPAQQAPRARELPQPITTASTRSTASWAEPSTRRSWPASCAFSRASSMLCPAAYARRHDQMALAPLPPPPPTRGISAAAAPQLPAISPLRLRSSQNLSRTSCTAISSHRCGHGWRIRGRRFSLG
ncbi:hypothetical protein ACEPPN_019544 [Leptodophora sp. 'Broadleaf-Isolate-01']